MKMNNINELIYSGFFHETRIPMAIVFIDVKDPLSLKGINKYINNILDKDKTSEIKVIVKPNNRKIVNKINNILNNYNIKNIQYVTNKRNNIISLYQQLGRYNDSQFISIEEFMEIKNSKQIKFYEIRQKNNKIIFKGE